MELIWKNMNKALLNENVNQTSLFKINDNDRLTGISCIRHQNHLGDMLHRNSKMRAC
jgi:hypothetical protein